MGFGVFFDEVGYLAVKYRRIYAVIAYGFFFVDARAVVFQNDVSRLVLFTPVSRRGAVFFLESGDERMHVGEAALIAHFVYRVGGAEQHDGGVVQSYSFYIFAQRNVHCIFEHL